MVTPPVDDFNIVVMLFAESLFTRKLSSRAGTFGVHAPFGDHFPIKMGELLKEPDVLQQLWTAFPGGHYILVVGDWSSGNGRQLLFGHHYPFPF
jgi:hypothetical protein